MGPSRLNEKIFVKYLEQCLPHEKYSMNTSYYYFITLMNNTISFAQAMLKNYDVAYILRRL